MTMSATNTPSSTIHAPLDGSLSVAPFPVQIRTLSGALHAVVASALTARRMACGVEDGGRRKDRRSVLMTLLRSYRTILTAKPIPTGTTLTPDREQQDTVQDLLLQLIKCLLPYTNNADALHEIILMMEGIEPRRITPVHASEIPTVTHTDSVSPITTNNVPLAPQITAETSSHAWPFALCGMVIDACASSPSIPYILFDGESPSTMVINPLSSMVWPPGLTTMANSPPNQLHTGYSYCAWIYMEPVVDASSFDGECVSPISGVPHGSPRSTPAASPKPKLLGDIGKAKHSQPTQQQPQASRFVLLSLTSEDGKTGLNLTYQSDTGTLTLRTGTSAASTPPTSGFGFRFGAASIPSTFEFQNVGLIPHRWVHLCVTHSRGFVATASGSGVSKEPSNPQATLYIDGQIAGQAKVAYVTKASQPTMAFNAWMGSAPVQTVEKEATVATASLSSRSSLLWRWRVASSILLAEVLSEESIRHLCEVGPRASGLKGPDGIVAGKTATTSGSSAPTSSPSNSSLPGLQIDTVSGCYALPSACAEAMDDVCALASRQRRTGKFECVGTAPVHSTMGASGFSPSGSTGGSARSTLSPSSLHEHLLAPALSSEQELLSQSDRTMLEGDSTSVASLVGSDTVIWNFHAKCGTPIHADTLAGATSSPPAIAPQPHTVLSNLCGSSALAHFAPESAMLYGKDCACIHPKAPQDFLRNIGGMRRILMLLEGRIKCALSPSLPPATNEDFHSGHAIRQVLVLLLVSLRRHPRNFRDLHQVDGYRLLGYFLRMISGRKVRLRAAPAAMTPASSGQHQQSDSLSSPLPSSPPILGGRRSSVFASRPLLDLHIVDLLFSLVGLSEKGMGGYVANLLALEFLLLDYRLWERSGAEVQLYVFQGLINACVGNPDRLANITALREARFVPWLLVILTNTKTFEKHHHHQHNHHPTANQQPHSISRGTPSGRSGALSPQHQETSLLNHILTLLRVLLMTELIDQELHLLANFAMTRTVGLKAVGTKNESPDSSAHSSSPQPSGRHHGVSHASSSVSLQTARRIQKSFVEMLLDVLLKISGSGVGGDPRALTVFNKSISFQWIFCLLKGSRERMNLETPLALADIPDTIETDCVTLTLKIFLILLQDPKQLAEFRAASLQGDATGGKGHTAHHGSTDGSHIDPSKSAAAVPIISFASLSNLLLPYATCPRIYPILISILFGQSIHQLNGLPGELSTDTIEELWNGLMRDAPAASSSSSAKNLSLVVPEVIDILIDLLARCIHLLAQQQQAQFHANPACFFSAAAAVASFVPPVTPKARVYKDAFDTGVLSISSKPSTKRSKFGIDLSRWNPERQDSLPSLDRMSGWREVVRDIVGPTPSSDLQRLHDPPSMRRPGPLATGTPTSAGPASDGSPPSVPNAHPGAPVGSVDLGIKLSPASHRDSSRGPSTSLMNGLVLLFMRLLHVSEDFGRVVSRSTFLRPFVSALIHSAQLNPLLPLAASLWQVNQSQPSQTVHHPPRPSSAHSHRTSSSKFGHVPLPPGSAAAPQQFQVRAHSSMELTHSPIQEPTSGNHLTVHAGEFGSSSLGQPISPALFSPEPNPSISPFSPASSMSFSSQGSASPDSVSVIGGLQPSPSPSDSVISERAVSGSATGSVGGMLSPSSSPPVIVNNHISHLSRMDLLSPSSASPLPSESPSSTHMNQVLSSPQYMAFQQAQLSMIAAPPSPPTSPNHGSTKRHGVQHIHHRHHQSTEDALQLSIDAISTPQAALTQALFHGELSARGMSPGPIGSPASFGTPSQGNSYFPSPQPPDASAFTFQSSQHQQISPMAIPSSVIPSSTVSTTASMTSSVACEPPLLSLDGGSSTSSIRLPIFRHSTSQLLLRFLRQVILYHFQFKKDGWMILEKVLESFPSRIHESAIVGGGVGTTTATAAANPTPGEKGLANFHRHEDLIRGFQSAVLSIVLLRVQDRLTAHAPAGASTLFLSATQAPNGSFIYTPTKFLSNWSRAAEVFLVKIQSGVFTSNHWNCGMLMGEPTTSAQPQPINLKSTAGSVIGLLHAIVQTLIHEGLKPAVEDLSQASAALQAKMVNRRKGTMTGSGSGGSGGSVELNMASSTSVTSANSAAIATLMQQPVNKPLKSLYDSFMNALLHLYDQFTMSELRKADLAKLNQYIFSHRKIVLGEYLLGVHISGYISAGNNLSGGSSTSQSSLVNSLFTSKSFLACVLYHLYNFQLAIMSPDELEQAYQAGAHADSLLPGDVTSSSAPSVKKGSKDASPALSPSSLSAQAQSESLDSLELKHSALALLIWIIRSKPQVIAELLRTTISIGGSSSTGVSSTAGGSTAESDLTTPGMNRRSSGGSSGGGDLTTSSPAQCVSYDVFTRGFDVLLSGFASGGTSSSGGSTRSSGGSGGHSQTPSSTYRSSAESEFFFSWLSIQRPIVDSVLSRTVLPEWKSWCKFLNGFLLTCSTNVLSKVARLAERDEENSCMDDEELFAMHRTLANILEQASAIDSQRYLRRIQLLFEQEQGLHKKWSEVRAEMTRLYASYSNSRKLYKHMPFKREFALAGIKKHVSRSAVGNGTLCEDSSSTDEDDTDLLLSPTEHSWSQPWKLDPLECVSRTRLRLSRATLQPEGSLTFTYPYKREADELREARKGQEAFIARQELARKTKQRERLATASVPLVERHDPDINTFAVAPQGQLERGATMAVPSIPSALGLSQSHITSASAEPPNGSFLAVPSISPVDLSSPSSTSGAGVGGETIPAGLTGGTVHGLGLVLAVSPTPLERKQQMATEEQTAVASTIVHPSIASPDGHLTAGSDSPESVISPASSSITFSSGAEESPSSASSVITPARQKRPGGDEAGEGSEISIGAFVSDSSISSPPPAAATGKVVPESSDRPSMPRRVQSLALATSHGSGMLGSPIAITGPQSLGSERKRKPSFFSGSIGVAGLSMLHAAGASRNLVASPRVVQPGSSPKMDGSASPTSGTAITPTGGDLGKLVHSHPPLFSQTSFRRNASFEDRELQEERNSDQSSATNSAQNTDSASVALPSPPTLQVDTPGGHARGAHAPAFLSPIQAAQVPSAVQVNHQQHVASGVDQPAGVASTVALSSPKPSGDAGQEAKTVGSTSLTPRGQDGTTAATTAEEDDATNSYYTSLLSEECTWFLYEERLRLLLDDESINYHYNCLRIHGLFEVSAIFLLCSNSIFIVDQYQVNPDGSIVRLEGSMTDGGAAGSSTGEKHKLLLEVTDDCSTASSTSTTISRRWNYSDIISVHKRRYLLRPAALELFFADHSNYLLVVNMKQRELIYKNLLTLCPNITDGNGGSINSSGGRDGVYTLPSAETVAHSSSAVSGGQMGIGSVGGAGPGGREISASTTPAPVGQGLGVGVGGVDLLAPSDSANLPIAPSAVAGVHRLTSNLTSIFFANHSLATEGAIHTLSNAVAAVLETFTVEWQHGFLSNFDYLSLLNSFSGRSYNDLTQYPVFPWVLQDYDSIELDLYDPRSFRDLSKPMGALDEKRASMHRQKYRETELLWKEEERDPRLVNGYASCITPGVSRAYHHATHYSSAAVVMYYLLRIEPYTQHFISFQSGRFDRADRLFSSVKQTFLTASKILSGDVKELIPEFYYLAPLLTNGNRLDLGRRQDGRSVDNVLLPPWAKGSPREFIRLHRQALESEHVSAHLHEWIDLIFGSKQSGDAAVKALNVFHFVTYAGNVDIDKVTDPILRRGMIEQIRSFGQTPAMLFSKPHPARQTVKRPGNLWTEPSLMSPTDTISVSHEVAQIFCMDRTMVIGGTITSSSYHASHMDRLLLTKPGQFLSLPTLQHISSFLPYFEQVNPPCVSPRNVRLHKAYKSSPVCNKLSLVQWNLPDASLRAGLIDVSSIANTGAGGLDSCASIASPSPTCATQHRTLKSYLNCHDGPIRVACVPLEGDDGTLVTGGDDCLLCVWQRADLGVASPTGQSEEGYILVGELFGHRAPITCAVVSKAFNIIVSGSEDGAVILWDLVRLQSLRILRFTPPGSSIRHVSMNLSTGDIAFASGSPSALHVVDVNGTLLARYPDPRCLGQGADVPHSLQRDHPFDAITTLTFVSGLGVRESMHKKHGVSDVDRADTGGMILTGHASGVIRIWHIRWLSFTELFAFVSKHTSADDRLGSASAPPPVIAHRHHDPLGVARFSTPLIRSVSDPSDGLGEDETDGGDEGMIEVESPDVSSDRATTRRLSTSQSFSPMVQPSASPPAPSSSISATFDAEVRLVNESKVDSALDDNVALAASQLAARNLSSSVFGSPGEEQLSDDWTQHAMDSSSSTIRDDQRAPGTVDLINRPPDRQWHLVCIGELLGHQVPVTALAWTRDASALYSADKNGNVVHFTSSSAADGAVLPSCSCKASKSKSRVKLLQSLSTGVATSAIPPPRVPCHYRECAHIGCELCHLDHVRTAHSMVNTEG